MVLCTSVMYAKLC